MSFLTAILSCLRKYARFSGRAPRSEYWNFVLFIVLVSLAMTVLDQALFKGPIRILFNGVRVEVSGPFSGLFSLLILLPLLAAGCRRMHDTGRSGIYLFYPLIVMIGVSSFLAMLTGFGPLVPREMSETFGMVGAFVALSSLFVLTISPLIVVWWLTRPSQAGDNRFGPRPIVRAATKRP